MPFVRMPHLAGLALAALAWTGCGDDAGSSGGTGAGTGEGGASSASSGAGGDAASSTVVVGVGTGGSTEICDALDNDGDGEVDEGCPCEIGATQACYVGSPAQAGVGACAMGSQTCEPVGDEEFSSTAFGPCLGSGSPRSELCADGVDNDCNGAVDEGCSACGNGVCDEACQSCGEDCGECTISCPDDTYDYNGVCCADGTGVLCNGIPHCLTDCPVCGDGICVPEGGENCLFCPGDCGCTCGDGYCYDPAVPETCSNCVADCGQCPVCGNDICDELPATCPEDCGVVGDGECGSGEYCFNAAVDCGDCFCGDGICYDNDNPEDCETCPQDCGACPVCGDGQCIGETCEACPSDCGGCCTPGTSDCGGVCCPINQCMVCDGLLTCAASC